MAIEVTVQVKYKKNVHIWVTSWRKLDVVYSEWHVKQITATTAKADSVIAC